MTEEKKVEKKKVERVIVKKEEKVEEKSKTAQELLEKKSLRDMDFDEVKNIHTLLKEEKKSKLEEKRRKQERVDLVNQINSMQREISQLNGELHGNN